MRSYLIDELLLSDMDKINTFLMETAIRSDLEKIFWVQLPEDILSGVQFEHHDCRPYVFAVELGTDWIKMEFFIRNLKNFNCSCCGYSTPEQRNFIFNYAHNFIKNLDIKT